jgi:hypothetical protein
MRAAASDAMVHYAKRNPHPIRPNPDAEIRALGTDGAGRSVRRDPPGKVIPLADHHKTLDTNAILTQLTSFREELHDIMTTGVKRYLRE